MPAKSSRRNRPNQLSHGRPPTVTRRPDTSLSSKATRKLIRSHHQLHKARARALSDGNEQSVRELDELISANGGLQSYQLASQKGQSKERGGDSSKVLMEWLDPTLRSLSHEQRRLRLLEVGALSTQNACSTIKSVEASRIDLYSQDPGILQQDFMERPLPTSEAGQFHAISLSLVLNYVPDAAKRGDMLQRTTEFLTTASTTLTPQPAQNDILPCLFLVLPAACVLNSRYLTEERLRAIMSSIGYTMTRRKVSAKLIFYLWQLQGRTESSSTTYQKELLNDGHTRNNFAITLG